MKKNAFGLLALMIVIILAAGPVKAETVGLATGNLSTADACGFGIGNIGGFLGLGDETTNFFGILSYGFSQYTEGRVKLGFSDAEGTDLSLMFGADFKYEIWDYYDEMSKYPFDMAFGGMFEYIDYGPLTVLEFGGNLIGSIPYRFSNGKRIIPYARANLRVEKLSADGGGSDSDFGFGLNMGAKYEISEDMGLYGEFQIDGNLGFFGGIEVRVF